MRSLLRRAAGGRRFSPWESPLRCGRTRYGCGHKANKTRAGLVPVFFGASAGTFSFSFSGSYAIIVLYKLEFGEEKM